MISGKGLPATCGVRFVAVSTAATKAPLPGAIPCSTGMVRSTLVATQGIPRESAKDALARSCHPTSLPNPCITAATSACATSGCDASIGSSPTAERAAETPAPPTARTPLPAGIWSWSKRAPAWAEVVIWDAEAGNPSRTRWAATSSGVREALFVTYRMPTLWAAAVVMVSAAPGTACSPTYTTPSRSSNNESYLASSASSRIMTRSWHDSCSLAPDLGRLLR